MNFIKKVGLPNLIMLLLCVLIILVAEYIFLKVDKISGLFIGLWAPTLLGFLIYFKLIQDGSK